MIGCERIWMVVDAVDGRLGIDGLSQHLQNTLQQTLESGTLYLFSNRRRNRMKGLLWDHNGVWLLQRRLHRGILIWPRSSDAAIELSDAQWQWLISGADWQRLSVPSRQSWLV